MFLLFLLAGMLGWPAPLAKVVSVQAGIVNNFLWNDLWTFRDLAGETGFKARGKRFARFNAICLGGLLIAVSLIWFFHERMYWNLYLSNFMAIGVVAFWNFGMNYRFSWNRRRTQSSEGVQVPCNRLWNPGTAGQRPPRARACLKNTFH
jgi:dolichol-phosphate mannosyltransferase